MVHQLRIYQIDPDKQEAFHRRFEDHAARIMTTRYGFQILAMWESVNDGNVEFVYLLTWPDRQTLERQWAAFMADEEWANVKQRVRVEIGGEPVQQVTDRVLEELPYSPQLVPTTIVQE